MIKEFLAKMIGRRIINDLKLEEGTALETKKWYTSKAVWSAILMVIIGGITPISQAFGHPVEVPAWIINVLTGLGIYGIRTGDASISK